jgi:Helix-turn-helix domain
MFDPSTQAAGPDGDPRQDRAPPGGVRAPDQGAGQGPPNAPGGPPESNDSPAFEQDDFACARHDGADEPHDPGVVQPGAFPASPAPPLHGGTRRKRRVLSRHDETLPTRVRPEHLTPAQRLLLLDTWQRSGLPAGDFAALVGVCRQTLMAWKHRFDTEGPGGLVDQPRGAPKGSKLPETPAAPSSCSSKITPTGAASASAICSSAARHSRPAPARSHECSWRPAMSSRTSTGASNVEQRRAYAREAAA